MSFSATMHYVIQMLIPESFYTSVTLCDGLEVTQVSQSKITEF